MTTATPDQAQQSPKPHYPMAGYHVRSYLHDVPAQNPRPAKLTVFKVVRDEDRGEYVVTGVQVSPCFRTPDEARTFRDTCGIDGVYCVEVTIYPRNDAEREKDELELFGWEQGH